SLTDANGLEVADSIRKQIFWIKDTESVPVVLVGCKSDQVYKREIAAETIASLAYQWDVPYFETSAKYNRHVNEPFEDLVLQ
ncbi:hypothetical protein B0H13DRAFT_1484218, partial [Mycena leptocephala]